MLGASARSVSLAERGIDVPEIIDDKTPGAAPKTACHPTNKARLVEGDRTSEQRLLYRRAVTQAAAASSSRKGWGQGPRY